MSGFDYPWTCQKIDAQISQAKSEIRDFLFDFIEELCPKIPRDAMHALANEKTEELYCGIEPCFEITRQSNEDMRSAAENQISDLEDKIGEKEQEVADLEKEVARLEDELADMRSEIAA